RNETGSPEATSKTLSIATSHQPSPRVSSSLSIVPVIGSILRLLSSGVLNFLHEGRAPAAATAVSQAHVPFSSSRKWNARKRRSRPGVSLHLSGLRPGAGTSGASEAYSPESTSKTALPFSTPTARTPGDCAAGH